MYKRINKTAVGVRQFSIFHIILALVVIASLLSMPVTVITKDTAFTPFEDAIFAASFLANDDGNAEDCPLKTEPERSFSAELVPAEGLSFLGDRTQSSVKPALAVLSPKEIISEIFIPPRSLS